MSASMFDKELPALADRTDPSFPLGPCAMGPVGDGDTVTWMRVWVFQDDDGHVAAATGTSGSHVGSAPEIPPFTSRWMIRTALEPGSGAFDPARKATAVALALATRKDGTQTIQHWRQDVAIVV
jgi:hypothetical protein